MTKTSIDLEWKALIEVYIDFINYKEFITPGNENNLCIYVSFHIF